MFAVMGGAAPLDNFVLDAAIGLDSDDESDEENAGSDVRAGNGADASSDKRGDNYPTSPKRCACPTKLRSLAIVALSILGFGIGMFINAIAKRVLPSGHRGVAMPSSHPFLGVLASVADPVFVIVSGRAVAFIAAVGVLHVWERRRQAVTNSHSIRGDADATAGPAVRIESNHLDLKLIFPVAVGVLNAFGNFFYTALCSTGSIATWSSMTVSCAIFVLALRQLQTPNSSPFTHCTGCLDRASTVLWHSVSGRVGECFKAHWCCKLPRGWCGPWAGRQRRGQRQHRRVCRGIAPVDKGAVLFTGARRVGHWQHIQWLRNARA